MSAWTSAGELSTQRGKNIHVKKTHYILQYKKKNILQVVVSYVGIK